MTEVADHAHEMTVTTYCALLTQAFTYAPSEVCGMLVRMKGDTYPIARKMRNVAEKPWERFEIAPEDVKVALDQEKDGRLDVVALYHSHVDVDATPSGRDLAGWTSPVWDYIIVSIKDGKPEIRVWEMDRKPKVVPLVVVGVLGPMKLEDLKLPR